MGYALKKNEENNKFTWNDYLSWPDNERWEVINGVPYNMPHPRRPDIRD